MGVVIYELLFGKRPFRGRTTKEIATRICKGSLVFPTTREVSDQCYDFISKVGIGLARYYLVAVEEEPSRATGLRAARSGKHQGPSVAGRDRLAYGSGEEAATGVCS